MRRYNVRPSKASSLIAFWMGIGTTILGFVLLSSVIGGGLFGTLFIIVWLVGAVGITVYHGKNAFGKNGVPTEHIEFEDTEVDSFDEELRKLKKLLDDGIITQEDFDLKKKQILSK